MEILIEFCSNYRSLGRILLKILSATIIVAIVDNENNIIDQNEAIFSRKNQSITKTKKLKKKILNNCAARIVFLTLTIQTWYPQWEHFCWTPIGWCDLISHQTKLLAHFSVSSFFFLHFDVGISMPFAVVLCLMFPFIEKKKLYWKCLTEALINYNKSLTFDFYTNKIN